MARTLYSAVFFVSVLMECLCGFVKAVEEHRQAFIQTDNELRYLVDGISLHLHEDLVRDSEFSLPSSESEDVHTYSSPIIFFPSVLEFKEHPVGMPHQIRVVVSNPNYHINVFLLSISGSSVHFHCSFFQDKVISPGGNTSFEVVFLSRQEGPVHNTLYIHTSIGSFKYEVSGVGTPNPYRLRPFVGAKVPVNAVYSPVISMYNPHSSTLQVSSQVTEMYSSGGDLHLELTSGEKEGPKQLWEIAPYETKPVMQASFLARVESNHTVYICIKTNRSNKVDLILPIEVEVTSAPGIYATTDSLEFGVMYSEEESRSLALNLLNHGPKPVQITSVNVSPANSAITLDFRPGKVPPDTTNPTQVALITFHPKKTQSDSQVSGRITVRTRTKDYKLIIPYHATILRGSLEYNSSATNFYVGESHTDDQLQHNVTVTNTFSVSVAIFHSDLPVEARQYFKVYLYDSVVLRPNETRSIGYVKLKNSTISSNVHTYLRLHTNISQFDIPLVCYTGKLSKFLPLAKNSSKLDIGALSLGEIRNVMFAIINENPVNVNIQRFDATLVHLVVELLAVHNGNISDVIQRQNFNGMNKSLFLKPLHFAIFRIGISAPLVEDSFQGSVFVETQFENLRIPVTFKTANGHLAVTPPNLSFESAFPGKVAMTHLYIQSTFSQPMAITSVSTLLNDERFSYHPPKGFKSSPPILQPNAKTYVGKLHFDVQRECGSSCYSGFDASSSSSRQWQLGLKLLNDVALVDSGLYETFWSRWFEVANSEKTRPNISFVVDTSEVRGFLVQAQASLVWPMLALKSKLGFPLTQIGNSTVKDLFLENPSSVPLIMQLVPLSIYPSPDWIINALKNSAMQISKEALSGKDNIFVMQDPICSKSRPLSKFAGITPQRDTLVVHVEPGGRVRVPVRFTPFDEHEQTSLLIVRNNLTIVEAVVLQGLGAYGHLTFASRESGAASPLQFRLTEKHLHNCDTFHPSHYTLPNFTVKRVFTVQNIGRLPVYVSHFDINGLPCEGFGFRVLDCNGFLLGANATRKIDIAFTPDFTLSRIGRVLYVHTSLGEALNFSLVATVPPHLLSRCASVLPRPHWEAMLYYVVVSLIGFLLFCVIAAGYLESDRIIRYTFVAMTVTAIPSSEYAAGEGSGTMHPSDYGKVFDLKAVASKAQQRSTINRRSPLSSEVGTVESLVRGGKHSSCVSSVDNNANLNLLKSQNLRTLIRNHDNASGTKVGRCSHSTKDKETGNGGMVSMMADTDSCKSGKRKSRKKSLNNSEAINLAAPDKSSTVSRKSCHLENLPPAAPSSVRNCQSGAKDAKDCQNSGRSANADLPGEDARIPGGSCSCRPAVGDGSWTEDMSKKQIKSELPSVALSIQPKRLQRKNGQVMVYPNAEEETSSTTTESSSPDVDSSEKCDSAITGKQKFKWPKSSSRTGTDSSKVDEADDEGEFEVSTRSRTRKAREHHKGLHPDLCPASLVLVHKPKPNVSRGDSVKESRFRDHREMGAPGKSRPSKKSSIFKTRTMPRPLMDTESSSTGKDSPPPEWDHPKATINTDEAYNELAIQTESFNLRRLGMRAEKSSNNKKPRLNEKGFFGGDSNRLAKTKLLPVGKIAPEPKKVDPKVLGPVGQKPSTLKPLPISSSSWNTGPPAPGYLSPLLGTPCTPPDPSSNIYGLPPILDCEQGQIDYVSNLSGSSFGCPTDPFTYESAWGMPPEQRLPDASNQMLYEGGDSWLNLDLCNQMPANEWEINAGLNTWLQPSKDVNDKSGGFVPWLNPLKDIIESNQSAGSLWDEYKTSKPMSSWPPVSPWSTPASSNATVSSVTSGQGLNLAESNPRFSTEKSEEKPYATSEYSPFSAMHAIWTVPMGSRSDYGNGSTSTWSSFFSSSPPTNANLKED